MAGRYRAPFGPAISVRGPQMFHIAERDARLACVGRELQRAEVVDADGTARRLLPVERAGADDLADRRGDGQPYVADAPGQRRVGGTVDRGAAAPGPDEQLAVARAVA